MSFACASVCVCVCYLRLVFRWHIEHFVLSPFGRSACKYELKKKVEEEEEEEQEKCGEERVCRACGGARGGN